MPLAIEPMPELDLSGSTARDERMMAVVDLLWSSFGEHRPISWVGFYLDQPDQPDDRRLLLGAHRDTPACSPIGLHGVCGSALLERKPKVIDDVRKLGDHYIACDPRDRAELVIPLMDGEKCWGVLDIDSWIVRAFDALDPMRIAPLLHAAGFEPIV